MTVDVELCSVTKHRDSFHLAIILYNLLSDIFQIIEAWWHSYLYLGSNNQTFFPLAATFFWNTCLTQFISCVVLISMVHYMTRSSSFFSKIFQSYQVPGYLFILNFKTSFLIKVSWECLSFFWSCSWMNLNGTEWVYCILKTSAIYYCLDFSIFYFPFRNIKIN